jgi:acetyl/propionyl-CoA carboxylase alpha subunit
MGITRLLIANRGEIAVRVARAAADLGIATVAVYSTDDARSLHVRRADDAVALLGRGPAAYLDGAKIIDAARSADCDAVHPGYGFLSESAAFATACGEAGLTWIGPAPSVLVACGDKTRTRALARELGIPVLPGTERATSLDEAARFFSSLPNGASLMVKAVAGGGGRGLRRVPEAAELADAYARAQSEAASAFGNGDVYVEQALALARHIEVQVLGDGSGSVTHLWERDCTLQRRYQKLIEFAPALWLPDALRARIIGAAVRMAEELRLNNLATFEFLVDPTDDGSFYFIEANPRLQVEHPVTEAVTGVDIAQTQLRLAAGASLGDLGLPQSTSTHGMAVELRVNVETVGADGSVRPSGGTITAFEPPFGPGVRVDSFAYAGYETNLAFDSLLAKLIVSVPNPSSPDEPVVRARRALSEFRIEGVSTNISFLQNILDHDGFSPGKFHTGFVDHNMAELATTKAHRALFYPGVPVGAEQPPGMAGVKVDASDPLAVLQHGKTGASLTPRHRFSDSDPGEVRAPVQGTVVMVEVTEGETVRSGQRLFVMEAMKMEHEVLARTSGRVLHINVDVGDAVFEGHLLAEIDAVAAAESVTLEQASRDLDHIRPDLAEVHARHQAGSDEARKDAVERRRRTGQRTARENIHDLCDSGSFVEYGPLVIAAQRRRRAVEDLIANTPADGLVAGIGTVNADLFGAEAARCIAMSYDYTVLAGTQGAQNHRKKDRMFELAEKWRLPIVFFTEGGGGRPGDTDGLGVAGLDCLAFNYFGRLSGLVPLVGVVSGRCFAGNAALLGCCDVIIATENANIGMGGPAMIEGGGLGVFRPEDVGPIDVQVPNGVVDIPVVDEADAVRVAKQYLSYFQGTVTDWSCGDQRLLRSAIPENRRRIYDVRSVVGGLADEGSVLELRRDFGHGMVTALVRIEGRSMGVIANNPMHLSGAIDSDAADKAARFMQLCDAFDLPLLFLCDTPGIMVGPEVEKTALVRHAARMFVTGASITVPFFTIILRKAYGLGAQAMAGGSFKAPTFTVSWPTGEFGGMGLEGAVKLGYRNELAAVDDPEQRLTLYEEMVERMYERGKAVNTASHFEIDDVIDPIDSRRWIMAALRSLPPRPLRTEKKRPAVDTW